MTNTNTANAITSAIRASIIRPGLLVSLKTSIRGNVSYQKVDLDASTQKEGDEVKSVTRWETTREIADMKEHEAATVTRSRVRSLIVSACCHSSFGLLCPEGSEQRLQEAIAEAQAVADKFNSTARHSRVECYVLAGRVADSDEQAARAIGAEVRGLLEAMQAAVVAADPAAIRSAATQARVIAGMLAPDTQAKVNAAIAEVRSVATEIVRRVEKAGESAASVVEGLKLEALHGARFAVLDMQQDESGRVEAPIVGRAIEFEASTTDAASPSIATPAARSIEID